MNPKDQEILDQLQSRMNHDLESLEVPASLQPDAITAMLKAAASDPDAQADKVIPLPQPKRFNSAAVRRVLTMAAMITVVIVGSVAMRYHVGKRIDQESANGYSLVLSTKKEKGFAQFVLGFFGKDEDEGDDTQNGHGAQSAGNAASAGSDQLQSQPAGAADKSPATKPNGEAINNSHPSSQSSIIGGKYRSGEVYFVDDQECWRNHTGYNQVYEKYAPATAMFVDQVRICFPYDGKNWMIQLWKGQYGFLFVGSEIGVYTAPAGTNTGAAEEISQYSAAAKEDWLKMSMDCYWAKDNSGNYKKVISRPYDNHWWATGYTPGQLTKYTAPRTELKVKSRITFKSAEMANLFAEGLKESGFKRSADQNNLVDDSYYQSGADVWLLWSTKNYEKSDKAAVKEPVSTTQESPAHEQPVSAAEPETTTSPMQNAPVVEPEPSTSPEQPVTNAAIEPPTKIQEQE